MATTWTIFHYAPKTVEDCSAMDEWVLIEYLPTLQKRTRWQNQTDNLHVGDIMKLADEGFTREDCPIGRVVKTHPGEDGQVRV
jgi:hypothetical protein